MRIPFRQGLVTAPANFLQSTGQTVSLVIAQPAVLSATIADKQTNYLISERSPVTNAWAGPFAAGTTYWLYIDINRLTGLRTFGHTLLEPIESAVTPLNPANGQMWFDTVNNQMKEWNSAAGRWLEKLRVFVACYAAGATFISLSYDSPEFTGTQVGSLQNIPITAGALMYDENGDPIKRNASTFFTTEDIVTTSIASSTQVKMSTVMVEAVAESSIPAYHVVRFTDFRKIVMATNASLTNAGAYGIVEVDAVTGDVVNVVLDGVVSNNMWNWLNVNDAIYVGVDGELTTSVPANAMVIGYVIDKNTIVLRPSLATVNLTNNQGSNTTGSVTQVKMYENTFAFNSTQTNWVDNGVGGAFPLNNQNYFGQTAGGDVFTPQQKGLYAIDLTVSLHVASPSALWPLSSDTSYGTKLTFNNGSNFVIGSNSSDADLAAIANQRRHFRPITSNQTGLGEFVAAVNWTDSYIVNIGSVDSGDNTITMLMGVFADGFQTTGIDGTAQVVMRVTRLSDIGSSSPPPAG